MDVLSLIARYGPYSGAAAAYLFVVEQTRLGALRVEVGALILTAIAFGALLYGQAAGGQRETMEILRANTAALNRVASVLEDRSRMDATIERLERAALAVGTHACPFAPPGPVTAEPGITQ